MPFDEVLTRWSIRLMLLLYVASLVLRLRRQGRLARWAWTLAGGLLLGHLLLAFHFYHGWSHAIAYDDTARKTSSGVGLAWGGGLYFNYLFAILWWMETARWWLQGLAKYSRPTPWSIACQAYLGFLAFNATVVFETGPTRWLGVVACCVLLASWWRSAIPCVQNS